MCSSDLHPDDIDLEDYIRQRILPPGYSTSISLNNPTIRQALNAIVIADPPSYWTVEYNRDDGGIVISPNCPHAHSVGKKIPPKKDMKLLKNILDKRIANQFG